MPLLRTAVTRSAVALAVAAVLAPALPASAADVPVRRLAGADRYATAAAVAALSCTQSRPVTIVRGDDFADALAAVNFGGRTTLLTPPGALPPSAAELLRSCRPSSGTVLGTPEVVSVRVEQQARESVADLRRTAGANRYSTAAAAYRQEFNFEALLPPLVAGLRTGFLTSGTSYADALSAGPVAVGQRMPLLLTAPDSLPAATREALRYERSETTGLQQVVVVGGPNAVSDQVVRQVEALGLRVLRVAGATRQETAVEVFRFAERTFGWRLQDVVLARGDGFADALTGAPHAGRRKAPLLLTNGVGDLGGPARTLLRSGAGTVRSIDVLGDATAVSDAVVQDAVRAASTG